MIVTMSHLLAAVGLLVVFVEGLQRQFRPALFACKTSLVENLAEDCNLFFFIDNIFATRTLRHDGGIDACFCNQTNMKSSLATIKILLEDNDSPIVKKKKSNKIFCCKNGTNTKLHWSSVSRGLIGGKE
jgi:hypothetical protein